MNFLFLPSFLQIRKKEQKNCEFFANAFSHFPIKRKNSTSLANFFINFFNDFSKNFTFFFFLISFFNLFGIINHSFFVSFN